MPCNTLSTFNTFSFEDFNSCMKDPPTITFYEPYKLCNLIKQLAYFKNSDNASYIDLLLKNKPLKTTLLNKFYSFMTTLVIEK